MTEACVAFAGGAEIGCTSVAPGDSPGALAGTARITLRLAHLRNGTNQIEVYPRVAPDSSKVACQGPTLASTAEVELANGRIELVRKGDAAADKS